jgi:hypothetical protein
LLTKIALAVVPLTLVGAVVSMASCAGTLENPGQFTDGGATGSGASSGGCNIADFDMKARLLDDAAPAGCAKTGCHNAGSSFFDFVAPNLEARMQAAGAKSGSCPGDILLDPADPEASVLYIRLAGDDCGAQMPFGEEDHYWNADELACALEWIANVEPGAGAGGGSGSGGSGSGGEGGSGAGGGSGGSGGR